MHGADAGEEEWKIGFKSNHYMHSHTRSFGVGTKSVLQHMGPTPIFCVRFKTMCPSSLLSSPKWQICPPAKHVCVNVPKVVDRGCQLFVQ